MKKTKVLTINGALNYLGISYRTFYTNYRPFVKPCGVKERAYLYAIKELDARRTEIIKSKKTHPEFEIVE